MAHRLQNAVQAVGLDVLGGFHANGASDALPEGTGTLILLGPARSGFWDRVTATPEFNDGAPDPLDRWSRRVIGALAQDQGATALFPFGGPPWQPFIAWAKACTGIWQSPVGLLVQAEAGLMVSIRGALALAGRVDLPAFGPRPCDTCAAPCRTACPVDALKGDRYDTAACKAHLARPEGRDCRELGCRARRSCPVSIGAGREPAQSAYHMASFLGAGLQRTP